jgi:hypothetical protein
VAVNRIEGELKPRTTDTDSNPPYSAEVTAWSFSDNRNDSQSVDLLLSPVICIIGAVLNITPTNVGALMIDTAIRDFRNMQLE